MYMCVCVYVCMYVCVCMYMCMYVCMYVCMYISQAHVIHASLPQDHICLTVQIKSANPHED